MAKGGYQIIDFEDVDFRSGQSVDFSALFPEKKVYETIERTRSPILLTNITVDGVEHRDTFVSVTKKGTSYCLGDNVCILSTNEDSILNGKHIAFKVEDTNVITPFVLLV